MTTKSKSDREQRREEKTAAVHAKDMQELKIEIRVIELKKDMEEAEQKEHISKLKEAIAQGKQSVAERKEKLLQALKSTQPKSTKPQPKQSGVQAVVPKA